LSPRRTLIMLASKAFLVVQGLAVGLLINTLLFLFTGVVLGWGVSAPEWYVHIQGKALFGIMAFSVTASLVLSKTADPRRNRETDTVIPST
jgi:hypothetical protein